MSSPALFDYNRDGPSQFAPPGVRRRSSPQANYAGAERVARLPPMPAVAAGQLERWPEQTGPVDLDADPRDREGSMRRVLSRRTLEPQQMPPPPLDMREEKRWHLFQRLALSATFAAIVAFAIFALLGGLHGQVGADKKANAEVSLWSGLLAALTPTPAPAVRPLLRLAAQNRSSVANHPIPLGIDMSTAVRGSSVFIAGLPVGAKLTVGTPSGENAWRIAAAELDQARVMPPDDFVGTMELAVDLRLANDAISDRNVVRLSWTQPKTNVRAKADRQALPGAIAAKPEDTAQKLDAVAATVSRALGHDEIATLLKRGKDLLSQKDISAARLLLRRAAEGGSAHAAFALAASYDPAFLDKIGVVGTKPDAEKAHDWYMKAAALGSAEAPQHAERLAHRAQ